MLVAPRSSPAAAVPVAAADDLLAAVSAAVQAAVQQSLNDSAGPLETPLSSLAPKRKQEEVNKSHFPLSVVSPAQVSPRRQVLVMSKF